MGHIYDLVLVSVFSDHFAREEFINMCVHKLKI